MKLLLSFILTACILTCYGQTNTSSKEFTQKIRTNASTFHKNFSAGAFEKNGPLVTENIYVNSNNAILIGRENFVNRIKRYNGPFPGLQLKDRIVLIDGNVAAVHYILQGEQKGAYGSIAATGNRVEAMSAEFFVMDKNALMKDLLTITQLDKLEAAIKGTLKIDKFQEVSLLPVTPKNAAFKEKIKEVIDNYQAYFNGRKWDELASLFDENVKINWNGDMKNRKDAMIADLKARLTAFPDLTFEIDRNVVDGDRGAIAYTLQGKQTGNFMTPENNIAPTGKTIMVREAQYLQFNSQGKIISVITVSNTNDFLNQLK